MTLKECKKHSFFKNKNIISFKLLEQQGLCNETYKIKCENSSYLLRVFKKEQHSYISREQEYKLQKKLSKKNLSAKVFYFDKNLMICKYIKGTHKNKLNKTQIINLSKKLKKLHKIRYTKKVYNFKKDLIEYKKVLNDLESMKLIKKSLELIKRLKKKYKFEAVLCHHDLNNKNILFSKNNPMFIDWEFACKNDRFFDLANVCIEFNFNKTKEKLFLKNYLIKIKKSDLKKLEIYKKLYKNLWKLWFKRYIN